MANYIVSGRQLVCAIAATALFVTASAIAGVTFINFLELPEVTVDGDNKCVRVINFRNGDGFVCQDKDITLRKYKTVVGK